MEVETLKQEFIENQKRRTKRFAVDSIKFVESLKKCKASDVITYQFIKSATSTGANYRAVCRARSKREFFSKLSIVVEEADESAFWLEVIHEAGLSSNTSELNRLTQEIFEILKVMSKSRNTVSHT